MHKKIIGFFRAINIKKILLILLHTQNTLSVLLIFSSPLPIRPKTSVGMLTGTSLLLLVFLFVFYKKKHLTAIRPIPADWLVLGFVLINALSLLGSPYVFDSTTFRLLLSAVVQYTVVRLVPLSSAEKRTTIVVIGAVTFGVAAMSVFQVVFRNQAILLAKKYLFGDAAFSLSWDLARGRAPQWGNIIVSFPLWILSLFLIPHTQKRIVWFYKTLGIALIPLSFIVSNFRWLTVCFFVGLSLFIVPLLRYKFLSFAGVKKVGTVIVAASVVGIVLSSAVFKYNLIDRLLLKEKQRDVVFTLGRAFLYQQAISAFASSPFIGVGTGNYRHIIERPVSLHFYDATNQSGESSVVETDREPVSSHNEMLTVLAETGAFGLIAFVLFGYCVVERLFSVAKTMILVGKTGQLLYPISFFISILMYILIGLFENLTPNVLIVVFFVYAASLTWFPHVRTSYKTLKR